MSIPEACPIGKTAQNLPEAYLTSKTTQKSGLTGKTIQKLPETYPTGKTAQKLS